MAKRKCRRRHNWELLPVSDNRPWTWHCAWCGMLKRNGQRGGIIYSAPPTKGEAMAKRKIGMRDKTLWKRAMKAELAEQAKQERCQHKWVDVSTSLVTRHWCGVCGTLRTRDYGNLKCRYRRPSNPRRKNVPTSD